MHWWLPFQHWLAIHTGTDNEPGPYYGFWSGFGSDIGEVALVGAVFAVYKRHNCHRRWCWRFGHYDFTNEQTGLTYKLCRKCHPDHPGRRLSQRHIDRIHQQNHDAPEQECAPPGVTL
jgi:hypothetical protein